MGIELSNVSLQPVGKSWEFTSELALEDLIWERLETLLQLKPFRRQYAVMGEICDILALSPTGQLAILELKNTEDRYIVQQLTRYYANLLEERPLSEHIDYTQPLRLIAIAPTFHRHNEIDRQYSRLSFEFIRVRVVKEESFFLELQFEDAERPSTRMTLPFREVELGPQRSDLPLVPDLLMKWLGGCSAADQQAILAAREQILSFHSRMQEMVSKTTIQYGTGKTKLCAEICFHRSQQQPVVFLWLTLPTHVISPRKPERTGRLRLWLQDSMVTYVGHVPKGLGNMRLQAEWEATPKSKWPRKYLISNASHRSMTPVRIEGYYRAVLGGPQTRVTLNELVAVALQKWLKKLGT
ncbi:endonuclease NucS [Oscillatoria sp. CS-180]|uniref:endonuclease NucS domain-containing protein n=1 Tax=Oscillatoria sp. CS-180 TaxID=3021720 RepID=UPI00232E0FCF|nr:endonuclease NucS domain-containing protein [Oscillatoria sp. CS-180]MDB9529576.1 endonuclease NucS [Oscillatoria sp. CS-180]